MKYPIFKTILFGLLALAIFSCSEDEEVVITDVRDQSLGTYNYRIKFYDENGAYVSGADEIGTFVVKKNTANDKTIDIEEGGEMFFKGNKIETASNGFTFDVPSQTTTDADGVTITIIGYDGWDLAGTTYHGAYETVAKKITAYFEANYDGIIIRFEVIATKI